MGIKMNQQSITIDGGSQIYLQDGTQGAGKILVSDDTGSLSWRSTAPISTFTNVVSQFPTGQGQNITVSALPFRHYFTMGFRTFDDGSHRFNLPTAPAEGDMIRITNTETSTTVWVTSTTHTIFYMLHSINGTSTSVAANTYLRILPAQTIELTFATKNPNHPANASAKPTIDRWYVTNLSSFDHVG